MQPQPHVYSPCPEDISHCPALLWLESSPSQCPSPMPSPGPQQGMVGDDSLGPCFIAARNASHSLEPLETSAMGTLGPRMPDPMPQNAQLCVVQLSPPLA